MELVWHLFLDLKGCQKEVLGDSQYLQAIFREVLEDDSFIVERFHNFSPTGVSGITRTVNYSLSIHTWPEHSYAAVDILCYECYENSDRAELIAQRIIKKLKASKPTIYCLQRDFNEL